jgi:AbrB family looped-hinge helix DNA binding protein
MCSSTGVGSTSEEAKFICRVGRGGRVTIPKSVRMVLTISKGDMVECTVRKVKPGVSP